MVNHQKPLLKTQPQKRTAPHNFKGGNNRKLLIFLTMNLMKLHKSNFFQIFIYENVKGL